MIRGVGLRSAIAVNVITMIGIGPLITIPLVVGKLHGSAALWGWFAGAIVALCDGLVWAELSSRFPGSGGTYVYLREAFGRERWGRLFAFLFNWQFIFYAPLLLASGYIGFVSYASYLWPAINTSWLTSDAVKIGLGILAITMLYRRITSVAKMSIVLCITAVVTLLVVIAASVPHFNPAQALSTDMHPNWTWAFLLAVGSSLYLTLYDYVGYADAALIGEEVENPKRVIPLSIVVSVLVVALLYVAMQYGVLGAVPWQHLLKLDSTAAQYVGTTVVLRSWGGVAAVIFTILVLVTAFASVYGNLLGFARVPFAAARDGNFFPVFRHLHPSGQFPDVALLVIGLASICASFFSLDTVIALLLAAIVLVQAVAQITAVFVLRVKGERAPFRMWLFPLPALVALVGWGFAFQSTGQLAMELSFAAVAVGVVLFLGLARVQRTWPFAAAIVAALCVVAPRTAGASYGHSAVVQQNGYPVFTVEQKPFFVYGAAFFYERLPRSRWKVSLEAYKSLGINTIDLYLIWNWHELSDDNFDFTGRTGPRRDLHYLLNLVHNMGFKTIIRPGPVIRNEWKNGGYPDWLLRRPEYNMPLHDILEGRYPATATLQNARSDDAAAEWMNNATHMKYATRWLRRALTEIKPWSGDVIAVALDDDQGAYIDNQTWPAPHFQAYVRYLDSVVHGVTGPGVPTFINTYQMKVTASSPVWAWGNWYQSDVESIGEHDRSQLEFSTALLQTQHKYPVMISEFQAGWLQGADEGAPRPADPANTELAIGTMLQMGAHGIVNFPVQDTMYPSGWEAPWTNVFYGWDAALSFQSARQARAVPTAKIGNFIRTYGAQLAQTHIAADMAILWSASRWATTNADFSSAAAATIAALQHCRVASITCALQDPAFTSQEERAHYGVVIDPHVAMSFPAFAQSQISGAQGNAALLVSNTNPRAGFLIVTNYSDRVQSLRSLRVRAFPALNGSHLVAKPRSTLLLPLGDAARSAPRFSQADARFGRRQAPADLPIGESQYLACRLCERYRPTDGATVRTGDFLQDGSQSVLMENAYVRLLVAPAAGGRALIFEDKRTGRNIIATVGALRDAVTDPPAASPRDYIARYTHPLNVGTFNRSYRTTVLSTRNPASVELSYDASDLALSPVHFNKKIVLVPGGPSFTVEYQANSASVDVISSLAARSANDFRARATVLTEGNAQAFNVDKAYALTSYIGVYDEKSDTLAAMWWRNKDLSAASVAMKRGAANVTLHVSPGRGAHVSFGSFPAASAAEARQRLQSLTGR
ncbi:MAG: hypothetical protein DLM50_09770 [Candidatus Meridianibacter frigidus]|nr:MAG: hypothetical protein DLM50_09770 [Candidatus Eremiobacteraeota bacterium]